MPFTFSVAEYADMIYVYGFCDGNSVQAVAEYQQRFPNRRIPTRRVFSRIKFLPERKLDGAYRVYVIARFPFFVLCGLYDLPLSWNY